jgi:UDP-N-acetylenolpyruvoylglucosamine reductase
MSGQLSFSVALLNAAGDGVVLSSINGRTETRTYAKVVLAGTGTQELSPEEEQAVRSARLGAGLPNAPQAASPFPAPARTGLPGLHKAAGLPGAAGGQHAMPIGGSRSL